MSLQNEIITFITEHIRNPANNDLGDIYFEKTGKRLPAFCADDNGFVPPLVGFARATDPMFQFYKEHIDPDFYRLPTEWLVGTAPEDCSVVSWILPQTEDTKRKARACKDCPPLEWFCSRVSGEACNRNLARAVVKFLADKGIRAIAPMVEPDFCWGDSEKYQIISNWSERHTAHICGLGAFGLCDGLLTPYGKAMRCGSVIVAARLEPTERKYEKYNEFCRADKGCRGCIHRCPAGAISECGHDKRKCAAYCTDAIKALAMERYGWDGYSVCGLCQTGVPCESGIPSME